MKAHFDAHWGDTPIYVTIHESHPRSLLSIEQAKALREQLDSAITSAECAEAAGERKPVPFPFKPGLTDFNLDAFRDGDEACKALEGCVFVPHLRYVEARKSGCFTLHIEWDEVRKLVGHCDRGKVMETLAARCKGTTTMGDPPHVEPYS